MAPPSPPAAFPDFFLSVIVTAVVAGGDVGVSAPAAAASPPAPTTAAVAVDLGTSVTIMKTKQMKGGSKI